MSVLTVVVFAEDDPKRQKDEFHACLGNVVSRDRSSKTHVDPLRLIQGHHLFIPLLDASLPGYLALIVSRNRAVGANLDAHSHDTDVRAAKGEHVSLNGKQGPIIRG